MSFDQKHQQPARKSVAAAAALLMLENRIISQAASRGEGKVSVFCCLVSFED